MNNLRRYLIFLFLTAAIPATPQVNDMGLWLNTGLEKKLGQQFSVAVSEEIRFNENISEVGSYFTDIGIGYRVNKNLKLSANYRYINRRNLNDSYSQKHRYYLDAAYRLKGNPFVLQLRERFQLQDDSPNLFVSETEAVYYLRSKLTLKYNTGRKYIPYIYAETYHRLNSTSNTPFRKIRYCAGIDYELNARHSVTAFYLLQKEINVNNPETDYIIGLGYAFNF